MSFLPDDYEPPASDGSLLKLQSGQNRLRILASPILGYVSFVDGKPVRTKTKEECPQPTKPGDTMKHFWALPVFSYETNGIQIWEITQASIQKPITNLARTPEWGEPTKYGITVTKTGSGLDTEYAVQPQPPSPVPEKIAALFAANPVYLDNLYQGADPFQPPQAPAAQVTHAQPGQSAPEFSDDIPF